MTASLLALPVSFGAPTPGRHDVAGIAVLQLDLLWRATADADGVFDRFQGRERPVSTETAVFSHDGNLVATTAKGDFTVRLFNAADGQQRWVADGNAETESAAFTRDNAHVVTGGEANPELRVWRVSEGTFVRGWREPRSVEGMKFNPAGTLLATGNEAGEVRVFDTSAPNPADWSDTPAYVLVHGPDQDLSGQESDGHADVNQVDWSADGAFLYSAGRNGLVRKWRTAALGQPKEALVRTYRGHDGSIKATRLSSDGRFIAAASGTMAGKGPSRVTLWNEQTGDLLLSHPAGNTLRVIETVAFDPGTRLLLAGGSEVGWNREAGPTLIWWIDDVIAGRESPNQTITWYDVEYLEFDRTGERLLSAHADGSVRMWRTTITPPQ